MGNKHGASKDRKRVDPSKRRRKQATSKSTCSSDSFLATTAATTTTITNADRMENTSTSLYCDASSSMSPYCF